MKAARLVLVLLAACSEHVTYDIDSPWPDNAAHPMLDNGKILITNSGDDTVSWLDVESLDVVFQSPVGLLPPEREGPHHGAALADGSAFFIGLSNYVPGSGNGPHGSHGLGDVDGYLLKYDTASLSLVGLTRVDRSPGDVRITPDGNFIMQSHFDLKLIQDVVVKGGTTDEMNATLALIDPKGMSTTDDRDGLVAMIPVCPAPHGIAAAADSAHAYVACWGSDELAIVSLAEPHPVIRHHVGEGTIDPTNPSFEPYAASVSPADGSVWVSCLKTGDLRIFDPAKAEWDTSRGPIKTGGAPFFGAFNREGSVFYSPNQASNALVIVDATSGDISHTLTLPQEACLNPHAVLLTPDEKKAIVVCEGDHRAPGSVVIVNIGIPTPTVDGFHLVGVFPDDAVLVGSAP